MPLPSATTAALRQQNKAVANPGACGLRGSFQLGAQAAVTEYTRIAGDPQQCRRHCVHALDRARIGIALRIAAVQASNGGGDQQQVGLDQGRDRGGRVVVVPQLKLEHGDGIVLVDDGQLTQLQQFLQCRVCIEIASAIAQVVMGQQDLRDRDVEKRLPEAHQRRLPECGQRLPLHDAVAGGANASAPCGYCPGR
jgi:hypothetical protein